MITKTIGSGLRFCRYYLGPWPGRGREPGHWRRLQEERLRAMVRYAYENVPLYREKYDRAGIHPRQIRTLDDLAALPLVSKDDLKKGFPLGILSRRARPGNLLAISTSGSTGSPVRVFRDRRLFRIAPIPFLFAMLLLPRFLKRWAGETLNRRISIIAPADEAYDIYLLYDRMRRLPRWLRSRLQYLDTASDPGQLLASLHAHRPDIVGADPVVLRNIAAAARRRGQPLPAVKLLVVGGALISDRARGELAQAYRGRVCEHYGAMEAGTMAFECPDHQGLHPLWPAVILETARDGAPCPPGVAGDVVVTNLWNTVTPVIRYSGLGDRGVLLHEACPCGSPAPRLKIIGGRHVDAIVLADGSRVHPFRLTLALEKIPRLESFQIVQEAPDRVRVRVVAERQGPLADGALEFAPLRQAVLGNLGAILGGGVALQVEQVAEIPRNKGSRSAPVLSLIDEGGAD